MRKSGARDLRRKQSRRPLATFEPLGPRIALSGSGISAFAPDMERPHADVPAVHLRAMSAGSEVTLQQRGAVGLGTHGATAIEQMALLGDDFSRTRPQVLADGSALSRPAMIGNWGHASHRPLEAQVSAASVQVSGTNLVLPGLLVSQGDAVTLVISALPVFGLPTGSQGYVRVEGREPRSEQNWIGKGAIDLPVRQAINVSDDRLDRGLEFTPGQSIGGGGPIGTPTAPLGAPSRLGDAVFALAGIESSGIDSVPASARVSNGWTADVRSDRGRPLESAAPQALPLTGQWAISKTELDEGLIELESPLSPRRKDRKPRGEEAEQHAGWEELQKLAEKIWSAWNDAWRDLGQAEAMSGEETMSGAEAADAAKVAKDTHFDAGVLDGLVELVVEGASPGNLQLAPSERIVVDQTPFQIDAGVVILREFEIATAAEAVPPATVRNADSEPKEEDAHTEAEQPTDAQPVSAAAVGAGLIMGLPFSLRRRRNDEDERQPRLRSI